MRDPDSKITWERERIDEGIWCQLLASTCTSTHMYIHLHAHVHKHGHVYTHAPCTHKYAWERKKYAMVLTTALDFFLENWECFSSVPYDLTMPPLPTQYLCLVLKQWVFENSVFARQIMQRQVQASASPHQIRTKGIYGIKRQGHAVEESDSR